MITEDIVKDKGLNIHVIETVKYKTISMVMKLSAPLNRQTITKRALLSYLLNKGTVTYPSEQLLQAELDDMYGAVLTIDGAKKGDNHIISIRLDLADDKYLNKDSSLFDEALELLHDIIFTPYLESELFPEESFAREKEVLKNDIEAIIDDKITFANMRLIDEMFENDLYGIRVQGYAEDLKSLNREEVTAYYHDMVNEDALTLYVLGNVAKEDVEEKLAQLFTKKRKQNKIVSSRVTKEMKKSKDIIEYDNISQAKLHIGYTTQSLFKDKDYAALHIFNGLFGGFPSSLLFQSVREKNSLAYYISSRLESHKGILIVQSGIDANKYEETKRIIDENLKDLKAGLFTNEDVDQTKELVISQLKETLDNPHGTIEYLFQQVIGDKELLPNEFISDIQKVTKDDVIEVAKKVTEHSLFLLRPERVTDGE